jgi:protein-L-isoaspartate(D-aspartate) O-methyltransferase
MTRDPGSLPDRRAAYARAVPRRFGGTDPRVEAAFGKIPREAFLGPPPWTIFDGGLRARIETGDPALLYQDALVVLDAARGINNGQPSLHAICIEALRLTPRDHVLHVGAGTGYYTAILAELAATIDAYEIEPDLAAHAAANLAAWPSVAVHAQSAFGRPLPAADAIYVNAGAARPDRFWLDALRDGGRLLFPLTTARRRGGMLLVERRGAGFAARFLMDCGFIPCVGGHDPASDARLEAAFLGGGHERVRSLWRTPPPGASFWFAGEGWYLSAEPPP